jgi:threonine dehydrogenase-like Zn-dependent dehydrogenase
MTTALATVYEGPERLTSRELPVPDPGNDEAVLEVLMSGVDGSELHIVRGELTAMNDKAPVILGDEIVGRIVACGSGFAASRRLAVGDVVAVEARWPCLTGCRTCRRGHYFMCLNRGTRPGYGITPLSEEPGLWGGYCTHVFVPRTAKVHSIPPGMPLPTALVACSVLANGIRWMSAASVGSGMTVAVLGPGPQGIASALYATEMGARVALVGLAEDSERFAVGRRFGAVLHFTSDDDPDGLARRIAESVGPVDIVLDTVGIPSTRTLAAKIVAHLGRIVNVAVSVPPEQCVDWHSLLIREVTVLNPLSHPGTTGQALDLAGTLLAKGIDVGSFVTHTFGIDEVEQALAVAAYQTSERPMKVVLRPHDG